MNTTFHFNSARIVRREIGEEEQRAKLRSWRLNYAAIYAEKQAEWSDDCCHGGFSFSRQSREGENGVAWIVATTAIINTVTVMAEAAAIRRDERQRLSRGCTNLFLPTKWSWMGWWKLFLRSIEIWVSPRLSTLSIPTETRAMYHRRSFTK